MSETSVNIVIKIFETSALYKRHFIDISIEHRIPILESYFSFTQVTSQWSKTEKTFYLKTFATGITQDINLQVVDD